MHRRLIISLIVSGLLFALGSMAYGVDTADTSYLNANPKSLEWFRDARFGMFVHWGPVTLTGQELSWARGGFRRGYPDADPLSNSELSGIPVDVYDNLYKRFNPVKFDASKWVKTMKSAGMKYFVFTTKHHDGFSMYDSKYTDYDIMSSPYGKDICKQLADACHANGIKLGWYYSPTDWYHPDFFTQTHYRYISFFRNQIREILTSYGKIDVMWFDGLNATQEQMDSINLYKMIRKLQPGILINNRLAPFPGDFDTPEQKIGNFGSQRPWESCITIGTQWSWKPNDNIKSINECINTLVLCAGGDGNLLLNISPKPDGSMEPKQIKYLKEVGKWLKRHGESIYGTRGGPLLMGSKGTSTYKGNRIYIHILDATYNEIKLPVLPANIKRCSVLGDGSVSYSQNSDGVNIKILKHSRDGIDTIVVLDLDKPASTIKLTRVVREALSTDKPAQASTTYLGAETIYGPDKAFDDNTTTRWATNWNITSSWLEVDLESIETFNQIKINEAFGRVREFELQCRNTASDEWRVFHKGTTIGEGFKLDIDAVTARYVRLNIIKLVETVGGPTIWEFQVINTAKSMN